MIFYSVLAASDLQVTVSIGGVQLGGGFKSKPTGGIGIYHGNVTTKGLTGAVQISVSRGATTYQQIPSQSISTDCKLNIQNYNAYTGSVAFNNIPWAQPKLAPGDEACVRGTGVDNEHFKDICTVTCALGYCPLGACQCLQRGATPPVLPSVGIKG